jgi:hypothetical protein
MPILANVAQTGAQASSDPKRATSIAAPTFIPIQASRAKAGINSDRTFAEKLTSAWLPHQQSSSLQLPAQANWPLNPEYIHNADIQNP